MNVEGAESSQPVVENSASDPISENLPQDNTPATPENRNEKELRTPERQKRETSTLSRMLLRKTARRELRDAEGEQREPVTDEEKALAFYTGLSEKTDGTVDFNGDGNPLFLPKFDYTDQSGHHISFDADETSISKIVRIEGDTFICQLRSEKADIRGMVTKTGKDSRTGLDTEVIVEVALDRTVVLDAQLRSEQDLYENAVSTEGAKLLMEHAKIIREGEEYTPSAGIDDVIEQVATGVHALTKNELIESQFFKGLAEPQQKQVKERLSDAVFLTAEDTKTIVEVSNFNRDGVRLLNEEIIVQLKALEGRTDELSVKQRNELLEEQQRLAQVDAALTPGEDGKTKIDKFFEQLQTGEMDDDMAKAIKEAILTGDTDAIFKAVDLSKELDEETRKKLLKAAKIAGGGSLLAVGLVALLALAAVGVVATQAGNSQRH